MLSKYDLALFKVDLFKPLGKLIKVRIKLVYQQIRLLTGLNACCKTRNIAIQLVLQQWCKTSCTFFVARFWVPLRV